MITTGKRCAVRTVSDSLIGLAVKIAPATPIRMSDERIRDSRSALRCVSRMIVSAPRAFACCVIDCAMNE